MIPVLTIIGKPGALTGAALAQMGAVLDAHAIGHEREIWLSPAEAADLRLSAFPAPEALKDLKAAAEAVSADIAVQPGRNRVKRLLVADMDSTMITCECIDEIADFVGKKAEVAAITERAMRGEIAFEPALRERVALLAGLPVETLAQVYSERVRMAAGAATLIATHKSHGGKSILVSGGFTFFTSRVAARLGFDAHQGNELEVIDARLSGRVIEPILGRDAKREALMRFAAEYGMPISETIAIGDGANDLEMIAAAGLGVAIHAKPKVAAAAPVSITHGDLTALLFLQGYRRDQFVGG